MKERRLQSGEADPDGLYAEATGRWPQDQVFIFAAWNFNPFVLLSRRLILHAPLQPALQAGYYGGYSP